MLLVPPTQGEFETHITILTDGPLRLERLREWAGRHSLKYTAIALDRGATPLQPMVTEHSRGTLAAAHLAADGRARQLHAEGFRVCRTKIEVPPWHPDVPATDLDAVGQPPGRYFEVHIKLLLSPDADIDELTALAAKHGAHLSRNPRRVRDDRRLERFVTLRGIGIGRDTFQTCLGGLSTALATAGYETLELEEEYVVCDSNPALDAGWIRPGNGPANEGSAL